MLVATAEGRKDAAWGTCIRHRLDWIWLGEATTAAKKWKHPFLVLQMQKQFLIQAIRCPLGLRPGVVMMNT